MAEIEEIPIEAEGTPENTQEVSTTIPENTEDIEDIQPAPKKRGRPPGSKNVKPKPKPAPKPKPKAKQKKPAEYEEYEDESEEDKAPPPRRRVRADQPVELDRHALASEVLGILQQQRYQRTSARRSHYASWFENMS